MTVVIAVAAGLAALLVLAAGAALAVAVHRLVEVREIRERPADQPVAQTPAPRTVYVLVPVAASMSEPQRAIPVQVAATVVQPETIRSPR
jgi:hypothetical protein